MSTAFEKPRLVASRCLGFAACRWNGVTISVPFIQKLKPFVDFVTTCPELEIGLGVPRDPIRLVDSGKGSILAQPATGKIFTQKMKDRAEKFLGDLGDVDGFILKGRSPSCGIKDVKIYGSLDARVPIRKDIGVFASEVLKKFPHLAIEEEGRLTNLRLREHFLIRIFIHAKWRKIKKSPSPRNLIEFHSSNKMLLMAYSQKQLRILGKIVANHEKHSLSEMIERYEENLSLALLKPARVSSIVNVMMHILGYFSDKLTAKEKRYFLSMLDKFKNGRAQFAAPLSILQSWLARFDNEYLSSQTFFQPFPDDLMDWGDSAKKD